ncbi:MAG: hypothetical protein JSR19_07995 [Proteobacteria bacterium]|nr:hypothetical protein [Pseudomonadota bacterium]HQR04378.1 hypothetical protein [Rhodocyclaceae bacterium]
MPTTLKAIATQKPPAGIRLCSPGGHGMVKPDSPAISVMTDFRTVSASTISSDVSLPQASAAMVARGVRLLFVTAGGGQLVGLITARDTLGERPLQILQSSGGTYADLRVSDLMCTVADFDTVTLGDVMHARVADVLATLKRFGRQHLLVSDEDPEDGSTRIRGVFSATQIGRQLGVPVHGFEVARTFAEIEAALAH